MIDRKAFFASVRSSFGPLKQTQVDGFVVLLDAWEKRYPSVTPAQFAYILATAWHETAKTMQPIEEYGKGRGKRYGQKDPKTGQTYYGRGYVQLTWRANYKKMEDRHGIPYTSKPALAMIPENAARILFDGMIDGVFTGKKLADYTALDRVDFLGARRIVNGTDRAALIAAHAEDFLNALVSAPTVTAAEPSAPAFPEQRLSWIDVVAQLLKAMFR